LVAAPFTMSIATPTNASAFDTNPCGATHPFGESGMQTLKSVTIFSATLSVLGSAFIIATWHMTKTHRTLGMHIICNLSVADLLSSLVFILDGLAPTGDLAICTNGTANDVKGFCTFNAASTQFFGLAAVLWTGCLALGLHLGLLRQNRLATQRPQELICKMNWGVWGASAFALVIMLGSRVLGPTGQWCWIRMDKWWAGLAFYYLPLFAVFLYSLGIYTLTRRTFISMQREAAAAGSPTGAHHSALSGLTSRLRGFLLVFGVINAFQFTNRFWDVISPSQPSFALYVLQSLLGPMQGVGNAIVYGYNPAARRVWSAALPRACACIAPPERRGGGVSVEISRELAESPRDDGGGIQMTTVSEGSRA
jgi:hypothetical protein